MKKLILIYTLLLISSKLLAVEIELINGCTLQDAIISANTGQATGQCPAGAPGDFLMGQDTIIFSPNSIITLTEPLPNAQYFLIFQGNNSVITRDPNAQEFPILDMTAVKLALYDLSITGGVSNDNEGGGIHAQNWVPKLHNVKVFNNVGGGIWSNTSVELYNSEVTNNVGISGADFYGSGISSAKGEVIVENSTISNNISASLFSGGGGIYAPKSDITVINSTISGNSTLNEGGGIYASPEDDPFLKVTIENSTIVNNMSGLDGGGIFTMDLKLNIAQSIISGNVAGNGLGNEVRGILVDETLDNFNLFGVNGQSGLQGLNLGQTDIVPPVGVNINDIVNLSLSDNGGPTRTHNLVQGSPALDAIFQVNCLSETDQAGKNRPIDGDNDGFNKCDIGSFEYVFVDLIFKDNFEFF